MIIAICAINARKVIEKLFRVEWDVANAIVSLVSRDGNSLLIPFCPQGDIGTNLVNICYSCFVDFANVFYLFAIN